MQLYNQTQVLTKQFFFLNMINGREIQNYRSESTVYHKTNMAISYSDALVSRARRVGGIIIAVRDNRQVCIIKPTLLSRPGDSGARRPGHTTPATDTATTALVTALCAICIQ